MLKRLWAGPPDDARDDIEHAFRCCSPGGYLILGTNRSVSVGARYEGLLATLEGFEEINGKYHHAR